MLHRALFPDTFKKAHPFVYHDVSFFLNLSSKFIHHLSLPRKSRFLFHKFFFITLNSDLPVFTTSLDMYFLRNIFLKLFFKKAHTYLRLASTAHELRMTLSCWSSCLHFAWAEKTACTITTIHRLLFLSHNTWLSLILLLTVCIW